MVMSVLIRTLVPVSGQQYAMAMVVTASAVDAVPDKRDPTTWVAGSPPLVCV